MIVTASGGVCRGGFDAPRGAPGGVWEFVRGAEKFVRNAKGKRKPKLGDMVRTRILVEPPSWGTQ